MSGLRSEVESQPALVAVVCQAYVAGVSTRRVDDLVKALGIEGISKSEVSRLAAELDATVAQFRERRCRFAPLSLFAFPD